MGRHKSRVPKASRDGGKHRQLSTRNRVSNAHRALRAQLRSANDTNNCSPRTVYKRRILEINLLRLIGAHLPSFGPEVTLPPPVPGIFYGLVDASGRSVALLNESGCKESHCTHGPASVSSRMSRNFESFLTQRIYTDGSYYRRKQLSGYAVWWGENHRNNACGPVPTQGPLSSAKSEEYAIFLALLQIKAEILSRTGHTNFEILTDALWVKDDILRWYRRWSKPFSSVGWKTSPTASTEHREILRVAAGLLWDLRARGVNVALKYVKGHHGTLGNELADLMAKLGSQTGQFIGPQPALLASPSMK